MNGSLARAVQVDLFPCVIVDDNVDDACLIDDATSLRLVQTTTLLLEEEEELRLLLILPLLPAVPLLERE